MPGDFIDTDHMIFCFLIFSFDNIKGFYIFCWVYEKGVFVILSEGANRGVLQKDVLKNLSILIEKHLQACNFIKKRLQSFPEFSKTPILKTICKRLLLYAKII